MTSKNPRGRGGADAVLEPDGPEYFEMQFGCVFLGEKVALRCSTNGFVPPHDVCVFFIEDGEIQLRGDLDNAAREWFELALKPLCAAYLKGKQSLMNLAAARAKG